MSASKLETKITNTETEEEKIPYKERVEKLDSDNEEIQKKTGKLYIVIEFLELSILNQNYKASSKYNEAIVLSNEGQKMLAHLKEKFSLDENSLSEAKLSLMLTSLQNIDLEATDLELLTETLNNEIIENKLLYPYLFGKSLYNKFYKLFNKKEQFNEEATKLLNADETMQLLKDTPIGVFQIRDIVIGPFGALNSKEIRIMPPSARRRYPMWHCSDVSCQRVHPTVLKTSPNIIHTLMDEIINVQKDSHISKISQMKFISSIKTFDPYDYNKIEQLVYLIGAFPEEELRLLLANLIDNDKGSRDLLPKDNRFKTLWYGNGEKISTSLEHNQCLQLILLFKDEVILNSLEELIFKNVIHIPETEIRKGRVSISRKGIFDIETQCSKYGFRSVIKINKETNTALIRLKNLIKELYSNAEEKERLEWKIRKVEGSNFDEKLGKYLLTENPRSIITNLIFDNSTYVRKTFRYLKYGYFDNNLEAAKEDYYINKILWKLGFDITVYPTYQSVFWKRHHHFLKVIKDNQVYSEEDRELIRSSGVNYFVSLEEILDYGLSFICWALLSDHYLTTRFTFNLEDARAFTAKIINEQEFKINDHDSLILDKEGKNTLYPLIKSFFILAEICGKYRLSKEEHKRSVSEYPSYFERTDIYAFPFKYKMLLLDLDESDIMRIIELLKNIANKLETKQISNVRNRIKHNRPIHEFPSNSELEDTCQAIHEVVQKMEAEGILPTIYVDSGIENDEFGRGFIKYKNYKGENLLLSNSSQFIRTGMPLYKKLQVILPNVHINNSIDKLRFKYLEKTAYSTYWNDYPKRTIDDEICE